MNREDEGMKSKGVYLVVGILLLAAAFLILKRKEVPPAPVSPAGAEAPRAKASSPPVTAEKAAPARQEVAEPEPTVAEPVAVSVPTASPVAKTPAIPQPVAAPAPEPVPVDETPEPVQVTAAAELATVNGVKIRGEDLALFGEAFRDKAQPMAPEMFDRLLNDAIDRELIRQAARNQGAELTGDQVRQLAGIPAAVTAQAADPASGNMMSLAAGTLDEQARFEQRRAESEFLLQNLLELRGIGRPDLTPTDEAVQQYYKEHASAFDPLPSDPDARRQQWQAIDLQIRNKLALATAGAYVMQSQAYIAELRSAARIDLAVAKKK